MGTRDGRVNDAAGPTVLQLSGRRVSLSFYPARVKWLVYLGNKDSLPHHFFPKQGNGSGTRTPEHFRKGVDTEAFLPF